MNRCHERFSKAALAAIDRNGHVLDADETPWNEHRQIRRLTDRGMNRAYDVPFDLRDEQDALSVAQCIRKITRRAQRRAKNVGQCLAVRKIGFAEDTGYSL